MDELLKIKPVTWIKKINRVYLNFMPTFKEYYTLKIHYATFGSPAV